MPNETRKTQKALNKPKLETGYPDSFRMHSRFLHHQSHHTRYLSDVYESQHCG